MKKTKLTILTVLMLVFTQACGTIMQGTTQEVGISSNPSKASVTINGQDKGTTPMVLDLKRKDSHMIRIELDGYETYETTLTRKVSGWVWGNIVFGGLIGLVVDAAAGGMYKLTPEQISAELRNGNLSLNENNDGFFIAVVLEPNPEWEKIGSLKASTN
ncbi:PEGA domain-containing protein [Gracilimonas halophila]|uniref:PEGA domain-containing protein n=1 Tax=Gracilimonas halophila TaxID=1834464 RepID=A0ABW5JKX5_9BACT